MATYTRYYNVWNSDNTSADPNQWTYEYVQQPILEQQYQPINFDFEFPKVKDLQCSEGWDPDEN